MTKQIDVDVVEEVQALTEEDVELEPGVVAEGEAMPSQECRTASAASIQPRREGVWGTQS